jgi:putative transposase
MAGAHAYMRTHAELTKLGFVVSEITVSRYLPRRPVEPDQLKRWVAFLRNHKDEIAAMDLFTVPTVSLRLLYGFFIIEHGRRRILHSNATFHPTAAWVIQQLREAFPYDSVPKYLIFDRDSIFSAESDTPGKAGGLMSGAASKAVAPSIYACAN